LVLLFIFAFDLWLENSAVATKFFGDVIKPYTDDSKFSVIWTILLLIGGIILWRQSVDKKEAEKQELVDRMRSKIELLVMANQELSSYRERDIMVNQFRKFVTQNAYVIGVQLYEYSLQHNKGKSTFKLTLLDGHARERIDVNAAQQMYYTFDIRLYREFRDVYEQAYRANSGDLEDENALFEVDPTPIMSFIQKYNHQLSIKPTQAYSQDDAMEFGFVNAGVRLLERAVGSQIEYFLDPDKKTILQSFQRLGYLQALLCEFPITFSHIRKNEKADRQYIASTIQVNERQYVYMILLDSEILNDTKRGDIMDSLTESFEETLVNCFDSIYNGIRNKKGDGEDADIEKN
jgi:hypothetical protein